MAVNIDKAELLNRILSDGGAEPLSDKEKERNGIVPAQEPEAPVDDGEQTDDDVSADEPEPNESEAVDDKSGEAKDPVDSEPEPNAAEKPSGQTKEVRKIIDLKTENKALRKELEQFREERRRAELVGTYGETYDEDTAKARADSDIRAERLERRIELAEFKADNAVVLSRFADAKTDAEHIFDIVKSSGMTAEQVCRGLYGDGEPLDVRRAKAAANGTLPRTESGSPNVGKAVNSSKSATKENTLTADERALMAKMIAIGVTDITEKEMLERRKRLS